MSCNLDCIHSACILQSLFAPSLAPVSLTSCTCTNHVVEKAGTPQSLQKRSHALTAQVQSGVGRTGKWWAHEHFKGVVPDIMLFAKGIASGFPFAGIAAKPEMYQGLPTGSLVRHYCPRCLCDVHVKATQTEPFVADLSGLSFRLLSCRALAASTARSTQPCCVNTGIAVSAMHTTSQSKVWASCWCKA